MMRKQSFLTIGVLVITVLFVGAGCSKKTTNTNTASVINTNSAGANTSTEVVNTNTDATPTGGTPVINGNEDVNTTPQANTNTAAATQEISITDFRFSPATLTVQKGTRVTWTNNDQASHTVTGTGGLESNTLNTGDGYSFTFDAAGTYNYHCSIHPTMTGTITVTQ